MFPYGADLGVCQPAAPRASTTVLRSPTWAETRDRTPIVAGTGPVPPVPETGTLRHPKGRIGVRPRGGAQSGPKTTRAAARPLVVGAAPEPDGTRAVLYGCGTTTGDRTDLGPSRDRRAGRLAGAP